MRHGRKVPTLRTSLAAAATAALLLVTGTCAGCSSSSSATTTPNDAGLVQPGAIHLAGGESRHTAAAVINAAEELYTFWNTGDASYLERADAPDFHDNTLPAGRPQGREGILVASRGFRAAVPDLRCQLVNLYVTGSTFTAQQVYTGHFTGTLDGHHGTGQPIRFNAIDIQHVGPGGKITEDWHIEDTLSFLDQAGVTDVAP